MASHDVIIVGGGHNGLVAAAYLARAGVKTLLLERRTLLGGACVTEAMAGAPGYRVSTGAAQLANLPPRIVSDLELERFGYRLLVPDPVTVFPFPDGRHIALWQDGRRTLREVAAFSAADARALPAYQADCAAVCDLLEPLLYADEVCTLAGLEGAFADAGRPDLFRDFVLGSIESVLCDRFESPEVQAVLGYTATFGTNAGPASPGTAYVAMHHLLGGTTGIRGQAAYVSGGMGGLADALAASASAHGADLRAGAEVARIVVRDDAVRGVELTSGERFHAERVISNADPRITFLDLVTEAHLSSGFADAVRGLEPNGVAMKVNCALEALPVFDALPRDVTPARVSLCPSLAYVEAAWDEARRGYPSSHPFMTVHMQSAVDPSLAPEGRHTLSCYAQFFPYRLAPELGGWEAQRERAGKLVLDTLARYAPDAPGKIAVTEVVTPLDLERIFAMGGGHQFHGDLMPGQLFEARPVPGCAGARTPLHGLYLCGAGAHPGGCVWGAPGERAARAVLLDRG